MERDLVEDINNYIFQFSFFPPIYFNDRQKPTPYHMLQCKLTLHQLIWHKLGVRTSSAQYQLEKAMQCN